MERRRAKKTAGILGSPCVRELSSRRPDETEEGRPRRSALPLDGFVFEVLDTLPASDEPGYDVKGELRVLEELWLERLQPYGARGYNMPPK